MIQANSLVRGRIISSDNSKINLSPIDGNKISKTYFISNQELENLFASAKKLKSDKIKTDFLELTKLAFFFKKNRKKLVKQIILDSGFINKDAEDLVECSIEFCEAYEAHLRELIDEDQVTSFSFKKDSLKKINLTSSPFGLIAATTPRNTPLITELTIIVHAIWSGNNIVLRPSPGVSGTVALLIEGLLESFSKKTLEKISVVFSDAKEFVNTSLNHADLLHYVGSTKYLESTLVAGIKKGVKVLMDGDGCSLIIIESSASIEDAARACLDGLIRCNGQICVSVRAIIVEEKVYKKFLALFLSYVKKIQTLPPSLDNNSNMGPLFSSAQASRILEIIQRYELLSGSNNVLSFGPNYIAPLVVGLEPNDKSFLRESLFGPVVGISYFKNDGWKRWLEENPINLTDVVYSSDNEFIQEFLSTSKSPRRVINSDPTIESVFEPWGAFLPSGWNDVSYWFKKYRNYYQLIGKIT